VKSAEPLRRDVNCPPLDRTGSWTPSSDGTGGRSPMETEPHFPVYPSRTKGKPCPDPSTTRPRVCDGHARLCARRVSKHGAKEGAEAPWKALDVQHKDPRQPAVGKWRRNRTHERRKLRAARDVRRRRRGSRTRRMRSCTGFSQIGMPHAAPDAFLGTRGVDAVQSSRRWTGQVAARA